MTRNNPTLRTCHSALYIIIAAAFAIPFLLPHGAHGGEKRILHVFTWADYFDSEVINSFQKEYDCEVVVDYFDSNELMVRALQYDTAGYDIITPSSYMCDTLYDMGMLLAVDHAKLPNLVHLRKDAAELCLDRAMVYSVPYTRTITGIGYDKTRVPGEAIGSWGLFDNAMFRGRMAMLTDMRECLGAALKLLGHSLNTTDEKEIAAAGQVVREWKRNIAMFDAEESKAGLISGNFLAVHGYNGDMAQAIAENPNLGFFVPEEGASLAIDAFVIPSDSPEPDLAHAFINHLLEPEMARQNMEGILYYMPNATALDLVDPVLRNNPAFDIPSVTLAAAEVLQVVRDSNEKYEKVWDHVMAED